jgi:hypothetical protein
VLSPCALLVNDILRPPNHGSRLTVSGGPCRSSRSLRKRSSVLYNQTVFRQGRQGYNNFLSIGEARLFPPTSPHHFRWTSRMSGPLHTLREVKCSPSSIYLTHSPLVALALTHFVDPLVSLFLSLRLTHTDYTDYTLTVASNVQSQRFYRGLGCFRARRWATPHIIALRLTPLFTSFSANWSFQGIRFPPDWEPSLL